MTSKLLEQSTSQCSKMTWLHKARVGSWSCNDSSQLLAALHAARLHSLPLPAHSGGLVGWWLVSPASYTHLSRMGFSCSSSGLALPRIRFRASAYSASRCARDLTGRAGLLVELGLLTTPLLVGLLRMRICGGGPVGRLSS